MTAEGVSPSERAVDAYKRLAASAEVLSKKSDEFARVIGLVDHVLKNLNLGITAWERISGGEDQDGFFWSQEVGYAKVDRKWGIAIRTRTGNYGDPGDENVDTWLFNDAPRPLRIDAIDKIPDLMEKLIKAADKTAKKIDEKMTDASRLADALQRAAFEIAEERKSRADSPDQTGEIKYALGLHAKPAPTLLEALSSRLTNNPSPTAQTPASKKAGSILPAPRVVEKK